MHVSTYSTLDLIRVYAVSCVISRVTSQENVHPSCEHLLSCELDRLQPKLEWIGANDNKYHNTFTT